MDEQLSERYKKFTHLIDCIYKNVQKIKTEYMSFMGLKAAHVSCLVSLYASRTGLTASELIKQCGVDKAAVSRTVGELSSMGYIASKDEDKKYNRNFYLTEKGISVSEKMEGIINEVMSDNMGIKNENERKAFYAALEDINYKLNEIIKKYGEKNGDKISY